MSRLIDADAIIKDLLKEAAHQAIINRPENARGLKYAAEQIKSIPTAYDVDKVVEQLKVESYKFNEYNEETNSIGINAVVLSDAIDIVMGGGKE